MKVINITEEQRDKLCNEVARLTFEFRKYKSVKCIYFNSYEDLGNIFGDVFDITIVRDTDDNFDELLEKYNFSYRSKRATSEYGVNIILNSDNARRFIDLNQSEVLRSIFLKKATILYDESGEFTEIKEQALKRDKDNDYEDNNLAIVFPPLDEALQKALDIKSVESDTQAVKEFTRTKLFKYLKNIL